MTSVQKKRSTSSTSTNGSAGIDAAVGFVARFRRFGWDIAGVAALAFGLMTLLAMVWPHLTAGFLDWWAELLWSWFGWGGLWMVFVSGVAGVVMLRQSTDWYSPWDADWRQVHWGRVFALELAAFATVALLAAWGGTSFQRAEAGLDGGRIGWALSYLLGAVLGPFGLGARFWRMLILGGLLFLSLLYGLGIVSPLAAFIRRWAERASRVEDEAAELGPGVSVSPIQGQERGKVEVSKPKRKPSRVPPEFRQQLGLNMWDKADGEKKAPPPRDEHLPPLKLLVQEKSIRPDERSINQTAGMIVKTLAEFGIPAKVSGYRMGPTVTQFAVEPGYLEKSENDEDANRQKIRVSQITSLRRDLALALSAERLRIEAPVPGRPYVGIEVPNPKSTIVRLRPILESEEFYKIDSPLAIALGRDVSGQPIVTDLGNMPHLLIAGTTGSGKSVCIAAITSCLVMNNTPEDLRLVMVDPKMVELVRFNGMPHLFGRVETDLERILVVLRWTVSEMDRRYKLLEESRSRNLDSYNRKARRRKNMDVLPRIVLLVDELADLMMSAPEQTEPALVRLAQMARATGIHLVLATQRPSTDVVTGLIKANFPARISFAVASSIDSRVILDTAGAESLLGHGDMLFLPPEAPAPMRAQGVMVTDQEVERIINYWQKEAQMEVDEEEPPWEEMLKQEEMLADRDDLIQEAIKIVQETQRASASMLQRRLRVGYPRAARLIDELHELGVVGPSLGGGREREVLIDKDEDFHISE
jgi:S-DNA-T family DNA segregation ATPase FtsK/SpoIIIE